MLNLKACSRGDLVNNLGNKKIVCFGAGRGFITFLRKNPYIKNQIECIIDNKEELSGASIEDISVYSLKHFTKQFGKNIVLVVTSPLYCVDIVRQLDEIDFFDGIDCYINAINEMLSGNRGFSFLKGEQKIPKKIHYCWFGNKKIPDHVQKCIDTWEKFCPDYQIMRWDESNYDISKNRYMFQAYEVGKYGFVPDYARLDIIKQYGGIYLDTDVELVKSLDDLLCYDFYCGFESEERVALGLGFGAVSGHWMLDKMLEVYRDLDFVKEGVINYTPSPYYQSLVIAEQGFLLNGMYQERNGIGIFPCEVFAPGGGCLLPDVVTDNTFSIHHYDASWVKNRDEYKKKQKDIRNLYIDRIIKNRNITSEFYN